MRELKPCPICGSENTVRLPYNDHADIERCKNCNLTIIVPFGYTMWNTRPIEDALNTRIAELEAAQRWIPVSEPPKVSGKYLLLNIYDDVYPCDFIAGTEIWVLPDYDTITHWMPLPKLPEVQE